MTPTEAALREALQTFIDHEVDYMRRNNLGDPEKQQRVIAGRAALQSVSTPGGERR